MCVCVCVCVCVFIQLTGKDTDAGKDWGQKRATEKEMAGWYHWHNGREFEQTQGDSEGQGSLACYSPWGCKESNMTERLNNKMSVCVCLSVCLGQAAAAAAKSLQSCPTLCNPIDGSPPGSPVPGIYFSNAGKWKVKVKSLNRVWLFATSWTTAYQTPPSMGFSRQEYWSGGIGQRETSKGKNLQGSKVLA